MLADMLSCCLTGQQADETENCVKCSARIPRIFVGTSCCGRVSLDHELTEAHP